MFSMNRTLIKLIISWYLLLRAHLEHAGRLGGIYMSPRLTLVSPFLCLGCNFSDALGALGGISELNFCFHVGIWIIWVAVVKRRPRLVFFRELGFEFLTTNPFAFIMFPPFRLDKEKSIEGLYNNWEVKWLPLLKVLVFQEFNLKAVHLNLYVNISK